MKKSTNQTRQPRKLVVRRETIATLSSLKPHQLDNVIGGSGSTESTCVPTTEGPKF
jgi:hypothetical protein